MDFVQKRISANPKYPLWTHIFIGSVTLNFYIWHSFTFPLQIFCTYFLIFYPQFHQKSAGAVMKRAFTISHLQSSSPLRS